MKMLGLLLAPLLFGCTADRGPIDGREASALQNRLAGRVAGEPRRCVPAIQGVALDPVDARTLVYDTPGTLYVNRLIADCPSLRASSSIIVETGGDQYCAGDRVRAFEPGDRVPGPVCRLGEFTPYRSRG